MATSKTRADGITITYPTVDVTEDRGDITITYPYVDKTEIVIDHPVIGPDSLFDNSNPNAGYTFAFSYNEIGYVFPVTPPEVKITIGSKNETVDLINQSEINILKGPSLVEIEFDARYPMREYPYSRGGADRFFDQWEALKSAKENKKPITFSISRPTKSMKYHNGYKPGWNTQLLCAVEEMTLHESYEYGDDVIVTLKLKQYKKYSVVQLKKKDETTSSSTQERPTNDSNNNTTKTQTHKTVAGDTLWGLAQKYYGDGSKFMTIYNANKDKIEADAKAHGYASSSNGNLLWQGVTLTIPKL